MSLIGTTVKPFKATTYHNGKFVDITEADLKGKWSAFVFYPADFTFVCPSEIIAFDKRLADFKAKNCEVVGVSVDSHFSHWAWRNTPVEKGGIGKVPFPMVSDLNKSISRNYGVLINEAISLRGLFLIDKEGIVRHQLVNDLPLGRSVDEALRLLSALQHYEKHGDVCPANWKEGEEAMKPSAEGVAAYLAKHGK